MNSIIPFGKYKGQPFEVLQSDPQYLSWLKTQDWFNTKFANFNTLIVNNFAEAGRTPEHNRLQAKFLDSDFSTLVASFIYRTDKIRKLKTIKFIGCVRVFDRPLYRLPKVAPIIGGVPVVSSYKTDYSFNEKIDKCVLKCNMSWCVSNYSRRQLKFEFYTYEPLIAGPVYFEKNNIDIIINVDSAQPLAIELKPNVSDDYPSILRQMVKNKSQFLIAETFDAIGASLDQVKKMFSTQGKGFYLISEIK